MTSQRLCSSLHIAVNSSLSSFFFDFADILILSNISLNLKIDINPLSANAIKWSNTPKQFVGNQSINCLRVTILWVWPIKGLRTINMKSLPCNISTFNVFFLKKYIQISYVSVK